MYRCEAAVLTLVGFAARKAYDMCIVIIAKSPISRRDVRVDFRLTNVKAV